MTQGQDLTPAEVEKYQEIRENLIQEGVLQEQSEIPSFQSAGTEPLIGYSSYTNNSLSVATEGSRASDFRPNGNRFYILGRGTENIIQYNLSSSWNIESASHAGELDISAEMGTESQSGSVAHGIYIRKSDGKMLWVLNRTEIWEYTLSSAWDITSATQTGYKDLSDKVGRGHDIDFKPDGSVLYVDDRGVGVVHQYELSSSWDIETAAIDYSYDISGQQDEVRGIQFNQDGSRMFLMDTGRQDILEYSVSDSYDLRSASFIESFSVASQSSNPRGLTFDTDFSRFYVTDNSDNIVYQYKIAIADPDESSLAASRSKVVANGTATARVTVTIRDRDGDRLSGRQVSLSSNSSNTTIDVINSTTNSNGEARYDVSNSVKENVTYTATTSGITIDQEVAVRFAGVDADESTVVSNREKVIANGSAESRITVTARDEDGDRLEDVQITLDASSDDTVIDNIQRDTDSNGEAIFDVSSTVAESVTFTASGTGVTIHQQVEVRFVTVDPQESSVAASQQKIHANGIASSTITVTARDEDGDELQGLEISLIPDGGSSEVETIQKTTDDDGEAKFRVTSKVAEEVSYSAKGLGVTVGEQVTLRFIPIDPDESEITISTQKILANGSAEATITITARDEDGNSFSNVNVTLDQSGGDSDISKVQQNTDSDGIAIFKVSNNEVDEITYSASAVGVTINQTVSARFVTVDPDETSIAVNPENVQANGEEESHITVTTRDEDGDVLQGARVILEALNGSSTIEDDGKTTNQDGEVVFTVTNSIPQVVDYRITAEDIELPQDVSIGFIPVAPVALSATEVEIREFNANWEMVEGAESYLIDISGDSSFTEMVEPYNALDVGNITSFKVDNVRPGTTYLYRVRATSAGLIGANSQPIQTTTFPETPEAAAASDRNALKFRANWNEAEGARKYRLDVATDLSFENILPDYNNLDMGTALGHTVTGLQSESTYYYRVRAEAGPRTSSNSNTVETSTLTISSEQSEISAAQLRVLANGEQANELRVTVKSDEGILLEGLRVVLNPEEGSSDIEEKQPVTDENGVAVFAITNTVAETVEYKINAADKEIGSISVGFLPDEGVLKLGDNFPNPYLVNTKIPLTLPRSMKVELRVYNSLGVPVRNLKDEQMDTGYYEIPFNGDGLAAGVYFYRLITDEDIKTRKMVLVK